MKITILTKKQPIDDKLGRLKTGETYDMPDHKANFYIQRGEAICYQTKVLQDHPCLAGGTTEQLSASLPAQVLQQTIANESESGTKKRGRKPKL